MVTQKVARVVIDTNAVVSGLLFGGKPGEVVRLWHTDRLSAFVSAAIIDEYVPVLTYPKFKLTEEEIQYLLYEEILPYFEVVVVPQLKRTIVGADPQDDKFILCAEAAKADSIISGDNHLLNLKNYRDIKIVSPGDFLSSFQ